MTLKNRLTAVALLASALTVSLVAQAAFQQTGGAQVKFTAKGTLPGLTINGSASKLNIKDTGDRLVFRVPLRSIDTGNATRTEHMRGSKYLDEACEDDKCKGEKDDKKRERRKANRQALELTVAKSEIKKPEPGQTVEGSAKADFRIKDISKQVTVNYSATNNAGEIKVTTKPFTINVTDYGVEKPTYLGVGVDPNVTIDLVSFTVKEQGPPVVVGGG